jgi:hypothetical protein
MADRKVGDRTFRMILAFIAPVFSDLLLRRIISRQLEC